MFFTICIILLVPFYANKLNTLKPKLCINCKFYKKFPFIGNEFGKCALFVRPTDKYLVDGITDHYYCAIARQSENMCGKEGKFYEDKNSNTHNVEILD